MYLFTSLCETYNHTLYNNTIIYNNPLYYTHYLSNFRITLLVSPRQLGQNHLPFGLFVSPTQLK